MHKIIRKFVLRIVDGPDNLRAETCSALVRKFVWNTTISLEKSQHLYYNPTSLNVIKFVVNVDRIQVWLGWKIFKTCPIVNTTLATYAWRILLCVRHDRKNRWNLCRFPFIGSRTAFEPRSNISGLCTLLYDTVNKIL